jgi:hypothetical protein
MANITVTFKDGSVREFKHEGRAGGSWTKEIRYEGGMAIIEDEWGTETAFPLDSIQSIVSRPTRF